MIVKQIDVRIEEKTKSIIEELSSKKEMSMSAVIRNLVQIGIGVEKEGGITIEGPFGILRPFVGTDFGERRISILLEQEVIDELEKSFEGGDLRSNFRHALHLGISALFPNDVKIKGPFGMLRPFAIPKMPQLRDKKAIKSFNMLF